MSRVTDGFRRLEPAYEVMTISAFAEYLQVSKSSLYELVQQRKTPGQQLAKQWRFQKVTVDERASQLESPVP